MDSVVLDSERTYTLGRDLQCDIRIQSSKISRTHLKLQFMEKVWVVTDLDSSNGTWFHGNKIKEKEIRKDTALMLGGSQGIEILLSPVESLTSRKSTIDKSSEPTRITPLPAAQIESQTEVQGRIRLQNRIRVGRDETNDWVIPSPAVSRFHAEITQSAASRFEIIDLKSANGTFVNGELVSRRDLNNGDVVTFGPVSRKFTSTGLEPLSGIEGTSLEIKKANFSIKEKKLLCDINLRLEPRSLTAIIGPSGAGKTTLLNMIGGRIKPIDGNVFIGGVDIDKNHKYANQKIGYVPQSDILHTELTVEEAFDYGARLRLPDDTSKIERAVRVDQVIEKLELQERKKLSIKKLSGGQRKRASIGLELITSPDILVLDEPSSGLDPGLDAHVMETLRILADDGQTVVLVTHSMDNLNFCDNVILMASGGRIAYFGPASSVFQMTGKSTWAEVFRWLSSEEAVFLRQDMAGSYSSHASAVEISHPQKRSLLRQTKTLASRYLRVILADRFYSSLLVLVPFLTGLLCFFSGGPDGLGKGHLTKYGMRINTSARSIVLVLVLGSIFIGLSTAIQEIVKESAIRKREQAIGVRTGAYLLSKLLVLGAIVAAQTLIFTAIVLFSRPMPTQGLLFHSALLEINMMVILLAITTLSIGLFISSILRSSEQTMPALVGITMVQVVLSGSLPIAGGKFLSAIAHLVPSYWATNGLAATTDLSNTTLDSNASLKIRWEHSSSTIVKSLIFLLIFNVLAIGFSQYRLSKDRR
jgi:ABC transport system ATP-binding/permease protein